MVVNLAAHTAFTVDSTVSGTVALTRAQLQGLVDEDYTTDVVTLSGTDILVLDVDLGNRVAVLDLRYYFDSATASGTVASGIQWLYKNYESDSWYSLTTTVGGGYYTTTTISGTLYPQYVRMVQTISGTGIIGSAREYEVNNDDTIVDYGSDGSQTEQYFSDSPIGTSDPVTVPVYNDGSKTATSVYVYIGNTDTDADDMLRISDAANGTYVSVDDGFLIDGEADEGLSWGIGNHDDTAVTSNKLVLGSFGTAEAFTELEDLPITTETAERAVTRWDSSNPFNSYVYYAQDSAFRMYSLADDTDVVRATMPFTMNPRDHFVYDPEGDKIYAFNVDSTTTNFYQYDPTTDTWTASLGSFSNSPVTQYPVSGATFIPSGVLNDGARSIIIMVGTGTTGVGPTNPVRIRLTDHNVNTGWGNLTGFYEDTDAATQSSDEVPVMMLTFQGSNLDAFPSGCQGVLWAIQSNYYEVLWLNYFVIDENTPANHRWHYLDLSNLPRSPSTYNRQDNWYPRNNDTFTYDEVNNRVWYVEDPGWQDASRCLHYFECDGTWNRGYNEMHVYTDLDPDGYFWAATSPHKKRATLNAKVYGDTPYFICFNGASVNSIYLYTPGGSGTYYQEGVYTSPVVKHTEPSYWRVKSEIPSGASIKTSENAVSATIEIRSSDTAPTAEDSHKYATFLYGDGGAYYKPAFWDYNGLTYLDEWLGDTHVYYSSSYWRGGSIAQNKHYPKGDDSDNVFWFVIWGYYRPGSEHRILIQIHNSATSRIYWRDINYSAGGPTGDYITPTCAVINSQGNTYVGYYGQGAEDDRLAIHTDTGWWVNSETFTGDQGTIYSLCLAGEAQEDLWFIKEDENVVYRYNPNLVEVTKVENPNFRNLNGICIDDAGGFYVGDHASGAGTWVHHYDKDGVLIATYDVSDHVQVVHRIQPDHSGGFWLIDTWGDQVARFANNGTFVGKVSLLSPRAMDSSPLGAHVMSSTYDRLYFLDLDVNIENQITGQEFRYSYYGSNWRGAFAQSIEVDGYLQPEYTDSDSHWGTGGDLEWSEVGKDTNFVPYRNYHQARITLRGDGSVTPEVEKLALPPAVKLYSIAPQSSKNVYLKTVVPQGTTDALRQGKIRTWFSMEE